MDRDLIQTIVNRADRLGFDSIWVQEQQIGRTISLEPMALLASTATLTAQVKLGVSVLVMGRHDPIQLAKQLASIDQLSGGRLIVGVGVGNRDVAPGIEGRPKDRRLRRLSEGVEVMKALWADGNASFQGDIWNLENVPMNPKPIQRPRPPLWFGARVPEALHRAVRDGDGWMAAGSCSTEDFREQLSQVRSYLAEANRDPRSFTVSKRVYVAIDDNSDRAERRLREWFGAYYGNRDMASRVSIWGPESIVRERLEEVADAGAEMILVSPVFDYVDHQSAIAAMWGLIEEKA